MKRAYHKPAITTARISIASAMLANSDVIQKSATGTDVSGKVSITNTWNGIFD